MAQRRGALADDLDALLGEADGLLEEDDDLTSALAEADALLGAPEPARPSAPTVRRPPPAEAPAAPAPVRTDQVRVPRAAVPASRAAQDLTVARGGRPTLPGGASGTDLEVIASSPASRSLIPPDPYRRPSPPQAPQEAPSLMERIVDLPGRVAGAPAQAVKGFFSGVTGAAANVAGTLAAGAFAKDAEEAKRLTVPAQFARQFLGPDPTLQPDVLDDPGVMLDPQWWGYMSGQLAGSVTALAGTGGGGQAVGRAAAGRLAALPGVAAKLAQLGGPAAATAGEAFLEASDTFTTLVQQGQDPQAAAQAAERVFSGNIALLGLSNHPLFDAGGGTFRKILTRAASEGSQEAAQQAMANIAQGRPTDEGLGTATLLGAVGGPVAGAGIDALSGQGRAPIAPPGPAGAPPSAVSSQSVPTPPPVDLRTRLQEAVAASQAARAASGFASSPAAQGQPNADLAAAVAEADAVLGGEEPPAPPVPETSAAALAPPPARPAAEPAPAAPVDTATPPAQTVPDVAEGGPGGGQGVDAAGRAPRRRVEDHRQASRISGKRREAHYAAVFDALLADAREVDPDVDPAELRREFDARVGFFEDQQRDARDAGADPRALLREIARLGGLDEADNGMGMHGELQRLREGQGGAVAGIKGVFRRRAYDARGVPSAGIPLDVMLQKLQQDPRWNFLGDIDDLIEFIDDVQKGGAVDYDVLPGTETVARQLGMRPGEAWWRDRWFDGPVDDTAAENAAFEGDATEVSGAADDLSFDTTALEDVVAEADAVLAEDGAPAPRETVPPVLYHGTSGAFERFEASDDIGFHFGTREQAESINATGDQQGRVLPVRLRISNPLRLPDLGQWDPADVVGALKNAGVITESERRGALRGVVDRHTVADMLARKGYDSIVYANETEGAGDSFIVFDDAQIERLDAPAAAEGLRTSKGRPMPPGTRLGTMAGSGERVFVEPVGPDGKHRIVDLDGSYSESISPKMLANERVGVRLDPVEADTLDTGEQQTRLPGEVGAVRDEERAQPTEEVPQQTLVLTAQEAPKPQGRIDFDAVVSEADDVLAMPAAGLRRRVLSTPERAVSTEPWMSGPSRAVRMEAIARHRFGGDRVVRNTETGHDIRIEPRGVKNALSHGIGPQKVAVVSALGDLLRDAVFVGRHTDGLRPGVVAVETYAARVRVDGAPFVARLVVREVQDGRRFYDHHLTSLEPVRAPGSPVQSGAGGAATSAPPRANRPSASPEKTLLEDALGVKSEDDGPDDVQPMARGAGGASDQVQPARASKPTLSGKGRNQGLALTHQPAPGTKTVAETPKNARPSDIVRDMAKLFEVPVGVGRLITHMALGYFHPRIREIRVRVANGLPVLMHEFGHASKRHFALSLTDARWRHELLVLGAPTSLPSYTVGQRLEEGRAEFWRLWVLEPGRAQQMAPNFFQATERRLDEMGDLGKGLRDLQRRAQAFLAADPVARVNLRIDFDGQGTQPVGAWVDRAAKHWIDDLHRLGQAVAAMAGGVPLPPSLNAYLLARNARGSAARASDFLETGVRGRDGQFIGPSLRAALQPVSDKLGEFAVYLVALRAKELHGRRMETGMTDVEVDGAIRAIESGPDAARFKQARDGVYQFQTAMLNYAREAGLLSVQAQRAIQRVNQFYVPFQRVMDDGATPGPGTGRRIADRIAPIKRIKGSGRDIINPLESIIKNAFAMVDAVEKNRAMQALATLVDKSDDVRRPGTGAGRWLRRIKDPQTLTGVKLRDVLVEVSQKAGAMWMTQSGPTINPDLEDMLNDLGIDPDQVVPVFQTAFTGPKGEQIVTVVRDGQKQFYQVADPMLFDALTQIAPIQKDRGELADVAETMAKLLRAGATLTVGFIARNPGRDTLSAFLQSRHGFIPVYDTVRGLVKTILHDLGVRHDEEVAQFWAQGVTQATLSGIDRKTLRAKVRQLADPAKHRRSVLANPLELLQALSAYSEVATRVGEFSLALRQEGKPHTIFERLRDQHTQAVIDENTLAAATLAARDVTTDFSRAGSLAREFNRYAAFFNARIQGYVRIAETIRRQPGTVAVNAGMLAAVAVFFKLLADDDDDYQELAEWEKLTYWHWRPTWGTDRADFFLRIPKPFEWAFIPNAVEAAVDYARDKDPEAFKLLKAQAKENARTFLTGFLPTAIVPALEVTTNYSLFRQGPIVSPWDADLPLEQQAGDWTSQTARALTRAGVPLAPAKIDHLLYGHFAGLGRAAVSSVVDPALRLAGVAPPRATQPEARWEDVPGVGALVRSAAPKSDAESIREFYDAFREMTGHERGFRRSKDDPAQQQRILDSVKRQRWRGREAEMKAAKKRIDAIADEIDAVYADPALTPREKTMSLDGMRRALVYEARVGLGYASTDHIRRRSPR